MCLSQETESVSFLEHFVLLSPKTLFAHDLRQKRQDFEKSVAEEDTGRGQFYVLCKTFQGKRPLERRSREKGRQEEDGCAAE